MPIMSIEILKKYSKDQELNLMRIAQKALKDSFKLSHNDIAVRLIVHEPHHFLVPDMQPELEKPDLYTIVNVDCFPGRSLEIKKELYRRLVDDLEKFGIPKNHIKILLRESIQENWGLRGGQAGCDVNVGYKVNI